MLRTFGITVTRCSAGERDRDSGGYKWTKEQVENLIERPRKRLARAKEQKKRLLASEDKRTTINPVEVARKIKPKTQIPQRLPRTHRRQEKSAESSLAKVREAIKKGSVSLYRAVAAIGPAKRLKSF